MPEKITGKTLGAPQREELLATLRARFESNMDRHNGIEWAEVQATLEAAPDTLWSLAEMERTGGEPDSAIEMAAAMGAGFLTEEQFRRLQGFGEFDTKTSSWLQTPPDIRGRGGAIFGDYRYGRVFVYHNGAQSYYAARGFRCALRV